MTHQNLEKMTSTSLMLPKDGDEKLVIIKQNNGGIGKILLREDTILANLQGCAGCGKTQFACDGMKKQWSSLCWGEWSDRKYYCLLVTMSFTFVLSLIGTIFLCFTDTLHDAILSNMALKNNTMAFTMWRKPSVAPLMKVHLFNYTNWERVRDGLDEKLHVEEVGPYVYSQSMERVNIQFEGEHMSYQEHSNFKYRPEKSFGAHYDQIIVPNLPLLSISSFAYDLNLNGFTIFTMNQGLKLTNHPEAFLKLPVHSFLWGYDDSLIAAAKPFLSFQGKLNFDKFGLLVTKNGTAPERLTINTGEHDFKKMNIIEKLNGKEHLDYWGTPDCNSIEGSDGSMFPPSLIDRNSSLMVFMPNLCRRLPFVYEKDVESDDGAQLLRYRFPANVFDDKDHNPHNQCYCEIDSATCPPQGVINVTACSMGAPALISFPHFYLADPKLREDVIGMKPDPIKHDTFLDLHPTLGIALNGKSAFQFNIQVRKLSGIQSLSFLKHNLILPVAWMDMVVEDIPDNIKSLVYHGTYSTAAVKLGLTVTCIIALITSGLSLCVMLVRRRKKPCAVLKKIAIETELKARQNLVS